MSSRSFLGRFTFALGCRLLPVFRLAAVSAAAVAGGVVAAQSFARSDLDANERARVSQVVEPTTQFSSAEAFELMQAGAGTVSKRVNADVFSHPAANLDFEGRQRFLVGNGLFRKDWVSSPSSTQASDGLGPLFNARSCQACHVKDGRGTVPGFDSGQQAEAMALLVRFGIPSANGKAAMLPDPVYGGQLQPFSVAGVKAEGSVGIRYEPVPVTLNGGEIITLMKPVYSLQNLAYGPLHPEARISPRLAPPMIGLGLLEAIHPDDILAHARKPQADGVSGRPNWVTSPVTGERVLGRFNWKAAEPTVRQQSAKAFSGDMGLSTPEFPVHSGDCTQTQATCLRSPHGAQAELGEHEVPGRLMDFVAFYSENLAVPERRNVDDPRVLAGKKLFYQSNCIACHVPKYVTRKDARNPAHRFQLIWPYTDLLLHDMGEGLADGFAEGGATGREWRTPPLWGIGLTKHVNPQATWLHDGRARTLLEAILWHGGEAQAARDRVVAMTEQERADLIRFLESL